MKRGGVLTGIHNNRKGVIDMCQTCGCSPCKKCGKPIEDGVCSGCKKKASECECEK